MMHLALAWAIERVAPGSKTFDYLARTVGRIGMTDDIATANLFLTSDAAGYIDDIEMFVDGGVSGM